ncbi:MAG: glycosyltransferase [Coriobacteriales bacterium]|jgi:glycosyltransferase involved in cell wall biosynthesis
MNPLVSVIVPVYNSERFVKACIRSLLAQTLEDIEVIAINDGSTDRSAEMLHAFADADPRVRVIDKENGGYGVAINRGIDEARGTYVGILESDDFADPGMLETLVDRAEAYELDVVRANFMDYWSSRLRKDEPSFLIGEQECDRVINPLDRDSRHVFYVQPALWSAIYRASFLRSNGLRLLETPGAAYQDTAFNFKVWACARRVMFVHTPFVHYRQDNESSSINNPGKVYDVMREYHEIDRWLREDRPDLREELAPVMNAMRCDTYAWNEKRIAEKYKLDFVRRFGEELAQAQTAGEVDPSLFSPGKYAIMCKSITDPQGFIDFMDRGVDPDRGLALARRKLHTMGKVWHDGGARRVLGVVRDKLVRRPYEPTDVDRAQERVVITRPPHIASSEGSPRVSVVVPVVGTAASLRACVDSVLGQSLGDFELICIDEGASPEAAESLARIAAGDARVRIVRREAPADALGCVDLDGLSSDAWATGMGLARAPYLMLLDGRDEFDYRLLQSMLERCERLGADVAVCQACAFSTGQDRSRPLPEAMRTAMLPPQSREPLSYGLLGDQVYSAFAPHPWNRMYRTDFISRVLADRDGRDDGLTDYDALRRAGRIVTVREVLVRHREDVAGATPASAAGGRLPAAGGAPVPRGAARASADLRVGAPEGQPRVSVVMPVYNAARFLPQRLDSLIGQTLRDIEIICVDDGSTDESLSILRAYAARDPRVRVVTQPNSGPARARNRGLELARGQYLTSMDADDYCDLDLFSHVMGAIDESARAGVTVDVAVFPEVGHDERTGTDERLYYSMMPQYFPDRPFTWRDNPDRILNSFQNWLHNKLFRTQFVRDNSLRLQELHHTEDMLFTCSALMLARAILCVDGSFAYYRTGMPGSQLHSTARYPLDFYQACCALHDFLDERDLLGPIHVSYANWVGDCILTNVDLMTDPDGMRLIYDTLHGGGLERLGLVGRPDDIYFVDSFGPRLRRLAQGDYDAFLVSEHADALARVRAGEERANALRQDAARGRRGGLALGGRGRGASR